MFLGTYKAYFSDKKERSSTSFRVILPKKFRRELGTDERFFIVSGLDGEIWGFSNKEWQKEAEKRLGVPLTDETGRELRRKFFSRAEECGLDSQGRFIISKELIDYAGIKNEILLIGAGDHFEIWDPKKWDRYWIEKTNE